MRPNSHREQVPERRCGNCRHSATPAYKDDLLCFCGDATQIEPYGYDPDKSTVIIEGDNVSFMDGEEYSRVWGGRVVDWTDICDEWEPRQ